MSSKPFYGDIDDFINNEHYRNVLYTSHDSNGIQLVAMSLKPKEEIGMEVHPHTTQFLYIIEGMAMVTIDKLHIAAGSGSVQIVPPGSWHNVVNVSTTDKLKIMTIYNPPEHSKYTLQKNRPIDG